MAVWTGPHLYSQTQINHVVLSEVHVLQNSCLITVKGYIAGRMNHDVDSHLGCVFAAGISLDRKAKERRVSCHPHRERGASGELMVAAGAGGASRHGSVLGLLGVHLEPRRAGWVLVAMLRTWVLCHPPVVTSQLPQAAGFIAWKLPPGPKLTVWQPPVRFSAWEGCWMSADEEGCWAPSVLHTALASLSLTLTWLLPAKAAVASFPSSKLKAFRKQKHFFFPQHS